MQDLDSSIVRGCGRGNGKGHGRDRGKIPSKDVHGEEENKPKNR